MVVVRLECHAAVGISRTVGPNVIAWGSRDGSFGFKSQNSSSLYPAILTQTSYTFELNLGITCIALTSFLPVSVFHIPRRKERPS